MVDFGCWMLDWGEEKTNGEFWIVDCGLRVVGWQNSKCEMGIWPAAED
jgi:hypothetical protein